MWKRCPDDKATKGVSYETNPSQACDGTKLLDVVLHFISQPLAHFENIALGLLFVALATQEDSIRMQNREIVFQQAHVYGITLESMLEYK